MVAVLLALARANRPRRPRALARTRPRRARGPGGVCGNHREREHVPRSGRRSWRRHRGRQRGPHGDPLQPAGTARSVLFRPRRATNATSPSLPDLTFAIGVSGIAARKTGEARDDYNRASRNAARVLERWRETTGRPDNSLAAAVRSSGDAPQRLRSWLADDQTLLDRFEQFLEESTQLVTAAADQLDSRRPRRFWTHRRSLAAAWQRNGFATRYRKPCRWRGWHASTARLPHRRLAPGSAAASGRSSSSPDAPAIPRSVAECVSCTALPAAAPRARFFLTRPGPASVRLDVNPRDGDRPTGA